MEAVTGYSSLRLNLSYNYFDDRNRDVHSILVHLHECNTFVGSNRCREGCGGKLFIMICMKIKASPDYVLFPEPGNAKGGI